jgi:hypothetical protein
MSAGINGTFDPTACPVPAEDRGPAVWTVTIVMLVLSTVFVVLRLISRLAVVKKFSWGDGFMVLAWVSAHPWHWHKATFESGLSRGR